LSDRINEIKNGNIRSIQKHFDLDMGSEGLRSYLKKNTGGLKANAAND
jgi:hypothetical protein